VKNVVCLLVFRGEDRQPVDAAIVRFRGTIPAGLAKRVARDEQGHPLAVDGSVQKIMRRRGSQLEYRILDFEIVD
jgi:hypothetical protein